jgi:hypothetical protein
MVQMCLVVSLFLIKACFPCCIPVADRTGPCPCRSNCAVRDFLCSQSLDNLNGVVAGVSVPVSLGLILSSRISVLLQTTTFTRASQRYSFEYYWCDTLAYDPEPV